MIESSPNPSTGSVAVSRRVLIPAEPGEAVFHVNTCYAPGSNSRQIQVYTVLESADTMGRFYSRISDDNGGTWSKPVLIYSPFSDAQGTHRQGESCLITHEFSGETILFLNGAIYPENHYSGRAWSLTRIMTRTLGPGGEFGPAQPIIEQGCTLDRWARDVVFGENCLAISFCSPLVLPDGTLILPIQTFPVGVDFTYPTRIAWKAGCLLGRRVGMEWEWGLSALADIEPERSCRGLVEPTVARVNDGRLLMVCRGSNSSTNPVPGRKWRSISHDNGRTWSAADAFGFETGESFYSPSAGSRLIHSQRTGRLYWIGNMTPANPDGNRPRFPLVIALVDQDRLCLLSDTVRVIDDRGPTDSDRLDLSNFRVFEDRQTGEFVLHMARGRERPAINGVYDPTSPAYEYRIQLS